MVELNTLLNQEFSQFQCPFLMVCRGSCMSTRSTSAILCEQSAVLENTASATTAAFPVWPVEVEGKTEQDPTATGRMLQAGATAQAQSYSRETSNV